MIDIGPIKVVTYGTSSNTHVFDSKGNRLKRVQSLNLQFRAGEERITAVGTQMVLDDEDNFVVVDGEMVIKTWVSSKVDLMSKESDFCEDE